ncbi:MAG: nucleoside-diphosphate sugar epimerase/dehydratase, partial [Caulobacteraceae bacterium]
MAQAAQKSPDMPSPQAHEPVLVESTSRPETAATDLKLQLYDDGFTGQDRRGPFRPRALVPSRSRLSGTMLARMFKLMDVCLLAAVTLAVLSDGRWTVLLSRSVGATAPFLAGLLLISWSLKSTGAYAFPARETLGGHFLKVVVALAAPTLFAVALADVAAHKMALTVVLWAMVLLLALLTNHACAWVSVRRWRKGGRLTPNVVVVGATHNAARLIEAALASREIAVLGVFDDRLDRAPDAIHGVPVLGDTRHLLEHRILPYIDRIVITVTSAGEARVRELITTLRVLPNAVTLFMDVDGQDTRAATLSRLT